MRLSRLLAIATFALAAQFVATSVDAQVTTNDPSQSSQRSIGRKGARQTSLFFNFTANQETTSTPTYNSRGLLTGFNESTSWNSTYTGFIDQGFFASDHLVISVGSGLSGSSSGDRISIVTGGLKLYLAPSSPSSLYLTGSGGVALFSSGGSNSETSSAGTVIGGAGFESATGPSSSFFIQADLRRDFASGGGRNTFEIGAGLRFVY